MTDLWSWVVPAIVVFGVTAIVIVALVLIIQRARRSPRARAAAEAARQKAGVALVQLDDAVDELDLEVGFSGALYGGSAEAGLRRSRMSAQHARDAAFVDFRRISEDDIHPAEIRRVSAGIVGRATAATAALDAARASHATWVSANVSAVDQIAASRRRLDDLRARMGDPGALVRELSARFDESEWTDAAALGGAAIAGTDRAQQLLADAADRAADPTQDALTPLAAADRALRTAEADARSLEEAHRLITQAAQGVPGELDAARTAVRQASALRADLDADDAARLGDEVRAAANALDALEPQATRRPTDTVERIARIRDRLDLAIGDARTAQQRLRGARTALPGTLAAARSSVARAEAAVTRTHTGVDARVRLASAQQELAGARQLADPVEALDSARRAIRLAEDATALADYDRLARS